VFYIGLIGLGSNVAELWTATVSRTIIHNRKKNNKRLQNMAKYKQI